MAMMGRYGCLWLVTFVLGRLTSSTTAKCYVVARASS